jgi:hypothetical protein
MLKAVLFLKKPLWHCFSELKIDYAQPFNRYIISIDTLAPKGGEAKF